MRTLDCRPIGALLVCLLAACRTIPAATPLVEATASLRAGTAASGAVVNSEILARGWTGSAGSFASEWEARQDAVEALSTYARSLQELSRAGNNGAEAVGSLGDALGKLASGVGLVAPTVAVQAGSEVASLVYEQIARAAARKDLVAALSMSQPVVEQIVGKLQADMEDVASILDVAAEDASGDLDNEFDSELVFRESLLDQRKDLYAEGPPTTADTVRLKAIQVNASLLASTETWHADYEARRNAIGVRAAAARLVLTATRDAVGAFAQAHQSFVDAVVDETSFDARELIEATRRLRDLIDGMRGS